MKGASRNHISADKLSTAAHIIVADWMDIRLKFRLVTALHKTKKGLAWAFKTFMTYAKI